MASEETTSTQSSWILEQDKFLSKAEIRHLREVTEQWKDRALKQGRATPVKDWFLICVATETGLRVQEIADLSCGDIQADNIFRLVIVRHGKGGKPRPVLVRKKFIEQAHEFLAWKQAHGESIEKDAPLFCARHRHMSKRALQKSYDRSIGRAGIIQPEGVGIHSLRHSYASFLLKASNFNLPLVQRQLGHASVRTTEIYAHVFDPEIQKAVEKLYE